MSPFLLSTQSYQFYYNKKWTRLSPGPLAVFPASPLLFLSHFSIPSTSLDLSDLLKSSQLPSSTCWNISPPPLSFSHGPRGSIPGVTRMQLWSYCSSWNPTTLTTVSQLWLTVPTTRPSPPGPTLAPSSIFCTVSLHPAPGWACMNAQSLFPVFSPFCFCRPAAIPHYWLISRAPFPWPPVVDYIIAPKAIQLLNPAFAES